MAIYSEIFGPYKLQKKSAENVSGIMCVGHVEDRTLADADHSEHTCIINLFFCFYKKVFLCFDVKN